MQTKTCSIGMIDKLGLRSSSKKKQDIDGIHLLSIQMVTNHTVPRLILTKISLYIYLYVFVTIKTILQLFRNCFTYYHFHYHLERHIHTNTFGNRCGMPYNPSHRGCHILLTPTLKSPWMSYYHAKCLKCDMIKYVIDVILDMFKPYDSVYII